MGAPSPLLVVLSDVHGNLPALQVVLNDMPHDLTGIIVAGDLTGGPHSVETTRLLQSLGAWMIQGNGEVGLLQYDDGTAPPSRYTCQQFALMRWDYAHLDRATLDFLRLLPTQRVIEIPGTAPIRVVHGSPRRANERLTLDEPEILDIALAQTAEPVLICGHTHIPWKFERDRRLVLNPGAICGPLNGDVRAQYALLRWQDCHWQVEHRAVLYDLRQIHAAFQDSGLLTEGGALARAFLLSIETASNIGEDFLTHVYRLAEAAGSNDRAAVPDAIWNQAADTFDWERF